MNRGNQKDARAEFGDDNFKRAASLVPSRKAIFPCPIALDIVVFPHIPNSITQNFLNIINRYVSLMHSLFGMSAQHHPIPRNGLPRVGNNSRILGRA